MIALMIPLMILNLLGGIVSGIWLAILDEWTVVIVGLIIGLLGNWVIGLLLLPGMLLFGTPGMALEKKGNRKGALTFAVLNQIYVIVLITAWCLGFFALLLNLADQTDRIPVIIWSYGVTTAPWAFLSQKDQQGGGNEFSAMTTLFAEIAFVVIGLIAMIGQPEFPLLILAYVAIMFICGIVNMSYAIRMSKKGIE